MKTWEDFVATQITTIAKPEKCAIIKQWRYWQKTGLLISGTLETLSKSWVANIGLPNATIFETAKSITFEIALQLAEEKS